MPVVATAAEWHDDDFDPGFEDIILGDPPSARFTSEDAIDLVIDGDDDPLSETKHP
jgi:hypothetical protein